MRGGAPTVAVKALDSAQPHALTVTCPPGFGAGRTLFVTTAAGDELEIVVPDGVESDEDFDVDMGDVSDEEPEPEPAKAPPPSAVPADAPQASAYRVATAHGAAPTVAVKVTIPKLCSDFAGSL